MSQKILFIKLLITSQLLSDEDLLLPKPGPQLPPLNVVENTRHPEASPQLMYANPKSRYLRGKGGDLFSPNFSLYK